MNYYKVNSLLFASIFFAGSFFIVQCDRDSQRDSAFQEEQQIPQGQTDTSDVYGQGDMNRGGQAQGFAQERETLVSDMEDLRDDITDQIQQKETEGAQEGSELTAEEMQNDLAELNQAIEDLRNTQETGGETEWNQARQDYQQLYDRLSEKYQGMNDDTEQ